MTELRIVEQDRRPFFTPKTLAQYFAVSERTVRQLLADGLLESDGGRIWAEIVDAYVAFGRDAQMASPERQRVAVKYEMWEPDERAYAYVLAGDPCCYCGATSQAVDHIVAMARGGEHIWTNLTAACKRCNSSKCARPLLSFLLGRASS